MEIGIQNYLKQHLDFWQFLKTQPNLLIQLLLNPEDFGLLKVQYQEIKHQQLISKLQKMGMMLRLMESLQHE